jgi:ATPase family associated with various cellular activities (AAA)
LRQKKTKQSAMNHIVLRVSASSPGAAHLFAARAKKISAIHCYFRSGAFSLVGLPDSKRDMAMSKSLFDFISEQSGAAGADCADKTQDNGDESRRQHRAERAGLEALVFCQDVWKRIKPHEALAQHRLIAGHVIALLSSDLTREARRALSRFKSSAVSGSLALSSVGGLAAELARCENLPRERRLAADDALLLLAAAAGDGKAQAEVFKSLCRSHREAHEEEKRALDPVMLAWLDFACHDELGAGQIDGNRQASWLDLVRTKHEVAGGSSTLVVAPPIELNSSTDSERAMERFRCLSEPMRLAGDLRIGPEGKMQIIESLLAEFPWFEPLIKSIARQLRLGYTMDRDFLWLRPMLLVGPPGCGKTRFGKRLAALSGCGHGFFNASGSSDNRLLAGTARGWSTAQPCLPAFVMLKSMTANPVIVVDEVDKISSSTNNGQVSQTLLSMLERQTARAFPDEALMVPLNLSRISWILTANELEPVSEPLRSRLQIVEVGMPGPEHFDLLMAGMLDEIAEDYEIAPEQLPMLDESLIEGLRSSFAKLCSPRRLAQQLTVALDLALDSHGCMKQ